jgi:hypothetical protein
VPACFSVAPVIVAVILGERFLDWQALLLDAGMWIGFLVLLNVALSRWRTSRVESMFWDAECRF